MYSKYDWCYIIKTCKNKTPFEVMNINHRDFVSTNPLEDLVINTKVTTTKCSGNRLKMRRIKLERFEPYLIQFKYNYNETSEFEVVNIKKTVPNRSHTLSTIDQPLLCSEGRTITKENDEPFEIHSSCQF